MVIVIIAWLTGASLLISTGLGWVIGWSRGWRAGEEFGRTAERRERVEKRAASLLHRTERRLSIVGDNDPGGAA